MHYFLGVDSGGTKTHALVTEESGQAVGFGAGGPGNWESVGLDGLTSSLQTAVSQALEMAKISIGQIDGAGMGLAGYDWPSQREMMLGAIKPLGLNCPLEIVNDTTLGIFAGTTQGWGVSVVSGTGCNCRGWGKDRHTEGRMVGGAPDWSGEYAGGGDIVARAMRAITFEWGKRGPATALSAAFLQLTGARDLNELIEGSYVQKYQFEPSDAMLVFQIAAQGDPEALKVIEWAGSELGQMACGVIRQLGLENDPVELVLVGSLYNGHPLMAETLRETVLKVASGAQIVRLTTPPVVGGVLLGMELVIGQGAYNCREQLLASTQALVPRKPR